MRSILITGAAGSGTTTLATVLARELRMTHLEAGDCFWLLSDPPYQHRVDSEQRHENLLSDMRSHKRTVVAGSIMRWGAQLENVFDLVVFLYLPAHLRLPRLEAREAARFGKVNSEFLAWAADYDNGSAGRSLIRHQEWLSNRACPVLKLEGDMSVKDRLASVLGAVDALSYGRTTTESIR